MSDDVFETRGIMQRCESAGCTNGATARAPWLLLLQSWGNEGLACCLHCGRVQLVFDSVKEWALSLCSVRIKVGDPEEDDDGDW